MGKNKKIMAQVNPKLAKAAYELVVALNKAADKMLPEEIAKIVKQHSIAAVGAAWIPIPGADVAAGAAAIWGMYARINSKIGLPFSENVLKSIGAGVATNLAAYAAGSAAMSMLKLIPGIGTVASALAMSGVQYAITLTSGYVYLKALTLLANRNNGKIEESDLGGAIKEVFKSEEAIKDFFNEAKKEER